MTCSWFWATFAGLTWLFGCGPRGTAVAFAACLSPGFISSVATIDTVSFPAVMGIAALAFVAGSLMRGGGESPGFRPAILLVLALFMLMNWSTLFSLFIAAVYVCVKRVRWKSLAVYFGAGLALGMAVFFAAMHGSHAGGTGTGDLWNAYLWGPAGYDGTGMTLGKAVVIRISAVDLIAPGFRCC